MLKLACILLLLTTACQQKEKTVTLKLPEVMYQDAVNDLKKGRYEDAAAGFEAIDREYPFTKYSNDALIMASYSYYKAREYEESLRTITAFKQANFFHSEMPYMEYLRALNYYDRVKSPEKAIDITEMAKEVVDVVLRFYPSSAYAADLASKRELLINYISFNHLHLARYYMDNKNILGALGHLDKILTEFPYSIYVPEALFRKAEIYKHINYTRGMEECLAKLKMAVGQDNNNKWLKHAGKLNK